MHCGPATVIAKHLATYHAPLKVGRRIGEAAFRHFRCDMLMRTICERAESR